MTLKYKSEKCSANKMLYGQLFILYYGNVKAKKKYEVSGW